jgi:hypothetical protein
MASYTKAYAIKNQWLNMSLYFINFMYNTKKPFKDTTVGKILKSKAFRYSVYVLRALPSLAFPPLLLVNLAQAYALETAQDYIQLWGNVNDGKYVCGYITTPDRLKDNNELLGGRQRNTKWLANGDYIKTTFIKLDKTDIISFFEKEDVGFSIEKNLLNSPNNYMRHTTNSGNITNQERENNDVNSSINNNNNIVYFLKGTNFNDIIIYAISTNSI